MRPQVPQRLSAKTSSSFLASVCACPSQANCFARVELTRRFVTVTPHRVLHVRVRYQFAKTYVSEVNGTLLGRAR